MNSTAIISTSQAYAYPRSPELVVFDDILLQNMFSIGSTAHCVAVSPMFWTLMLIAIFVVLFLVIGAMNWCVHPEKHDQWRTTIKHIFRRTDLLVY